MAELNIETVIKSSVEKALNKPIVDDKSITEWAAIGMKSPNWVSVKDRLPPMEKRVLVFCKSKSEHTQNVITITEMTDVNQFNYKCKTEPYWRKPWDFFYANFDITHWMPLPEPPKEDD